MAGWLLGVVIGHYGSVLPCLSRMLAYQRNVHPAQDVTITRLLRLSLLEKNVLAMYCMLQYVAYIVEA